MLLAPRSRGSRQTPVARSTTGPGSRALSLVSRPHRRASSRRSTTLAPPDVEVPPHRRQSTICLTGEERLYPGVAAIGEQTGRKQAASRSHVSTPAGGSPGTGDTADSGTLGRRRRQARSPRILSYRGLRPPHGRSPREPPRLPLSMPDGEEATLPSMGRVIAMPKLGGLHHRYSRIAA